MEGGYGTAGEPDELTKLPPAPRRSPRAEPAPPALSLSIAGASSLHGQRVSLLERGHAPTSRVRRGSRWGGATARGGRLGALNLKMRSSSEGLLIVLQLSDVRYPRCCRRLLFN